MLRATVFRGPIAVLVNRGTASGGEVVASALQEASVGRVFGARTCGCLSVGRPLQLGDASGPIVTVEQALTGRQERRSRASAWSRTRSSCRCSAPAATHSATWPWPGLGRISRDQPLEVVHHAPAR
ncbi:MAG: S41 family peptidase [Dehalococcoidia bacterium]